MSIERSAEYRAPAKVNLALRVLGRRDDGYHELESIMVPVSLFDRVALRVGKRVGAARITCRVCGEVAAPEGEENLAWKAAEAVLRFLDVRADVEVRLTKCIPAQAGLGGGSSDAATVLRRLPGLLGRRIGRTQALDLARGLGADVPFFLACRPSLVRGLGDRLEELASFPSVNLVVAVPPTGVDTAWAYANALPAAATRPLGPGNRRRPSLHAADLQLSFERLLSRLSNDFESGVVDAFDDVERVRRRLREVGAVRTVMSGSGSAMVGVFSGAAQARAAAAGFDPEDRAFAVRVLAGPPAPVTKSQRASDRRTG